MSISIYTPDSTKILHIAYADFVSRQIGRPVHVVQYDDSLPLLAVNLFCDGQPYIIPSNADISIKLGKSDGKFVYNQALGCDTARHIAYFEITYQMVVLAEVASPVIEVKIGTSVAASSPIGIIIDRNPVQRKDIESTSEWKVIKEAVEYTKEAVSAAAGASASRSAAAVSEQNAQNYKNLAQTAASSSSSSASASADSAVKAKASEMNSANSASASADSAAKAQSSATKAAKSEENAKSSENAAKDAETNAAASKTAASASASTASTKAGEAATSATNAETYATKSQSYAIGETGTREDENVDNAKYYMEQSDSYASDSYQYMNEASQYADIAQNYASNAAEHALYADNAVSEASGYADNAEYYYEQAKSISEGLAGALIPMGTVTFADLLALSNAESGWMYNISDQFTTTADFNEGAGKVIPAGANVYKTAKGKWDVLAGTPVSTVNGQTGDVVVTAESIGALSKDDLSNHLGGPGIPIIQSATDRGGLIEIGKYIDFHDAGSQADFDVRLYCDQGKLVSTAPIQAPGGTVSGNITGSGGGAFATDGNVYIKSQGYDGWLTNYLGQYLSKTGGTLSGDLVFQGRGKKLYFGNENPSCPYIMCNNGSDSDLEIYAPSGYVSINDNLLARKDSYFNGDVHFENRQKNIGLKMGHNVAIDFAGTGFETSSASIGGGYPVFYGHGCIFGDNIDEGIMEYVARGHYYDHCFCSINENGKNLRTVTLSDGNVSCDTVNGKSADYAENWEWADGNPNGEDRVGLFVTFQGSKIRISKKGDILAKVGVVSGSPCIIGDSDDGREWKHKYLKDVYGRLMRDEEGGQIINPAYDPDQAYISRSDRPEWDPVGTHGKLVVRDDGTCQEDGFCVPTDGGIATAAEDGFYVMERLDESHIRIYMR